MKKIKGILLAIVCVFCLFVVTGCGNKTAISAEDFKVTMDGKGYKIIDATSQFSEAEYVKQVYVALSSDSKYQIEFYEFDTDNNGSEFYKTNSEEFEKNQESGSIKTTASLGNYNKLTLSGSNKYQVVSRIGNTAVYVDVDAKYKEDAKTILEELGY